MLRGPPALLLAARGRAAQVSLPPLTCSPPFLSSSCSCSYVTLFFNHLAPANKYKSSYTDPLVKGLILPLLTPAALH